MGPNRQSQHLLRLLVRALEVLELLATSEGLLEQAMCKDQGVSCSAALGRECPSNRPLALQQLIPAFLGTKTDRSHCFIFLVMVILPYDTILY